MDRVVINVHRYFGLGDFLLSFRSDELEVGETVSQFPLTRLIQWGCSEPQNFIRNWVTVE